MQTMRRLAARRPGTVGADPAPNLRSWRPIAALAALAYLPFLLSRPGLIVGDSADGPAVDPVRALLDAAIRWDAGKSFGSVTDRTFGVAFPMAPYFWLTHLVGVPTWIAQRFWMGSILFAAGLGVIVLLRAMAWDGPGWMLAAVTYMVSPYVLTQIGSQSVALLAWAALPWMIAITVSALEDVHRSEWTGPARFAVLVALCGSANVSSLLYVLPGPILWGLYTTVATREVPWRRALLVGARFTGAGLAVSSWWLVGLYSRPRAEISFIRQHSPLALVESASVPSETIRGLGDWSFFKPVGTTWVAAGDAYQRYPALIALTFVPIAIALVAFGRHRFHNRVFFVSLMVVGIALSTGMSPAGHPEALGRVLHSVTTTSVGSFLLPTTRAAALTTLALAVGFAAGIRYVMLVVVDRALHVRVAALVLVLASVPAYVSGHGLDGPLLRGDVPDYWRQVAAALDTTDHAGFGILEVPGLAKPEYTWGSTRAPISFSLIDRPVALRTDDWPSQPETADLLAAIDDAVKGDDIDPKALGPLVRMLGVDTVVVRGDTHDEKAVNQWQSALTQATGDFGPPQPYGEPGRGQVFVYPVIAPQKLVRLVDPNNTVVVSGTAPGLVAAADQGLVATPTAVAYSGMTDTKRFSTLAATVPVVVTDASRWTDVDDARLDPTVLAETDRLWPARYIRADQPAPLQTDVPDVFAREEVAGGLTITASSYGSHQQFEPEHRPTQAFDGDPATAWTVVDPVGENIEVRTGGRPMTVNAVRLVQPDPGAEGLAAIREVEITADKTVFSHVLLDPSSLTQTVELDLPGPVSKLQIKITGVTPGSAGIERAGFAEVTPLGDSRFAPEQLPLERLRVPADALRYGAALAPHPLAFLFARRNEDGDAERRIARVFTLDTAREMTITGVLTNSKSLDAPIRDDCADAAVSIDGHPVRLTLGEKDNGEVPFAGQAVLPLPAGDHTLLTAVPDGCGAQVEHLMLSDRVGTRSGPVLPVSSVAVDSQSDTAFQLSVGAIPRPMWLTAGVSFDSDWIGFQDRPPELLNGFAAGWYIDQTSAGSFPLSGRWTPQRAVNVGVLVSVIAFAIAIGLSVIGGRRRQVEPFVGPETLRAGNSNLVVLAVLGVFGLAAGPIPAIIAGSAALLLEQRPQYHRRVSWLSAAMIVVVAIAKVAHATFGDHRIGLGALQGPAWIEVVTWTAVALSVTAALANTERPPIRRYPG